MSKIQTAADAQTKYECKKIVFAHFYSANDLQVINNKRKVNINKHDVQFVFFRELK